MHGRSRKNYIVDPDPAWNYTIPATVIPSLSLYLGKQNGLQDLTPTPMCPHHIPCIYASAHEGHAAAILLVFGPVTVRAYISIDLS